jgi:hypothetical protein
MLDRSGVYGKNRRGGRSSALTVLVGYPHFAAYPGARLRFAALVPAVAEDD